MPQPLSADNIRDLVITSWTPAVCPICDSEDAGVIASDTDDALHYVCVNCQRFTISIQAAGLLKAQEDPGRTQLRQRLHFHAATSLEPVYLDLDTVRAIGSGRLG